MGYRALGLYLASLGCAMAGLRPKLYTRYDSNLALLRRELERMRRENCPWVVAAGVLFAAGNVCLAALVGGWCWGRRPGAAGRGARAIAY